MSLVPHIQKRSKQDYGTPFPLYRKLNEEFDFTLDPCTTEDNPLKTPKFYTIKENGLVQSWENERVFCNPPYSQIKKWVQKAYYSKAELVVLLTHSATDAGWFHKYLYKKPNVELRFLRGRLKFRGFRGQAASFASMLAIITVSSNTVKGVEGETEEFRQSQINKDVS